MIGHITANDGHLVQTGLHGGSIGSSDRPAVKSAEPAPGFPGSARHNLRKFAQDNASGSAPERESRGSAEQTQTAKAKSILEAYEQFSNAATMFKQYYSKNAAELKVLIFVSPHFDTYCIHVHINWFMYVFKGFAMVAARVFGFYALEDG